MVILMRHYILLTLRVHETFPPLPFELIVFRVLRIARRERNLVYRELRRPVRVEQPVRLLVRIGELRIAAAGQQRQGAYDPQQMQVAPREILFAFRVRVTPASVLSRIMNTA